MNSAPAAINLQQLLEQLRQQGLPIGAAEYERLQVIFQAQPNLSAVELRDLLCVVLAKDEQQRRLVNRVFNHWVVDENPPRAKHRIRGNKPPNNKEGKSDETPNNKPKPVVKKINYLRRGLLLLLLILFGLGATFWLSTIDNPPKPTITEKPNNKIKEFSTQQPKTEHNDDDKDDLKLVKYLPVWSAESITIKSRSVAIELLPPALLLALSGLGLVWLLTKAWDKTRRREPLDIDFNQQANNRYHNPSLNQPHQLLNPQDRFKMAWGVSHYLSDDHNQKLDTERSVKASAEQGLPVICFEQSKQEREVWLWQDSQNNNPAQAQLCKEIIATLNSLQVTTQQGFFNQLPYQVKNKEHLLHQMSDALPLNQPLVLVCLNSLSVNNAYAHSPHETEQLWNYLAQWQHLAIVDCSQPISSLKLTLKDYPLTYLLPMQVSEWFASQGHNPSQAVQACVIDDIYRWACACALPQRVITQEEAYALHNALELSCTWQYPMLSRYGSSTGKGIDFRPHQIPLINTLQQSPDLKPALDFWLQRLETIDKHKQSEDKNWQTSTSYYEQIVLRQNLLRLSYSHNNKPSQTAEAVNSLFDVYSNSVIKDSIEQHLGQYTCKGMPNIDPKQAYIYLPYDWQQLEATTQQQLLNLGFAGKVQNLALRWDKATSVSLGLLAGLACWGLMQSVMVLKDEPAQHKTQLGSATPPNVIEVLDEGKLFIGTAQNSLAQLQSDTTLKDNQTAEVAWLREIKHAQEVLTNTNGKEEGQLWRLGTTATPLQRDNHIAVSLAIINEPPHNADARVLAALLLDSGTADQVLISDKWRKYQLYFRNWSRLPNSDTQQVQRLYVNETIPTRNRGKVINHAAFDGSAAALLTKLSALSAGEIDKQKLIDLGFVVQGKPYFMNIPIQPVLKPITLANGIELMPIPAGAFMMGSENGDDDEKPVHKVTIAKPFWLGKTEVTFEQYDAYIEAHNKVKGNKPLKKPSDEGWGRGNRPVINVSWQEVQGYVKWLTDTNTHGLSCRLPSEAEWEYAARASTTTNYYWGDKVGKNNANCDGCGSQWDNKQTAPVGSFKPNPWGLYDMSGNVYEWTQDKWHDNYEGAPKDGSVWQTGDSPFWVLRGGSWGNASSFVRSSARYDVRLGYDDIGFRIFCSLH